jgi:MFS transporter, DHA1 family, inner membrane transport protein
VMVVLATAVSSFAALVAVFAIWGFVVSPQQPAIQHRIAMLDPVRARVMLAWNSTAIYAGMAVAPTLGALVVHAAPARTLPLAAIAVAAVGMLLFQLGYRRERRERRERRLSGC